MTPVFEDPTRWVSQYGAVFAAPGIPADAYFGLALMAVVFVGAVIMTVIVVTRNRRDTEPSHRAVTPELPDYPEQLD